MRILYRPMCYWGLVLCFILPTALFGQKVINALHLDKKEPKPLWFEYCRLDGGLVTLSYMVRHSTRQVGLFKYGDDFKRQWSKFVFEQNSNTEIDYLTVLGERILVFVSETVPREKQIKSLLYEYRLDGTKVSDGLVLTTVSNKKQTKRANFFTRALNRKKLLAYRSVTPEKSTSNAEVLDYHIFDADTMHIKKGQLTIPYPDDQFKVKDVVLGNKGSIFILGKLSLTNRIRTPNDYQHIILRYRDGATTPERLHLGFKDRYITDLTLRLEKNEDAVIAGFYSEQNDAQIIGVVFARWQHQAADAQFIRTQKFDEKFLEKYLTPRQIRRGRELGNFYLDNIILRNDGGVLLMAEQYFITSTSYQDMYGFWYTRDLFHYDDIIVTSVSESGQIEWQTVVEKSQASEYGGEMSYLCLVGSQQLLLFFKTRQKGVGTNIFYVKIGMDGKKENPRPFIERFSGNDIFYRASSEQIANDKAIIVYYQSRKKIFSLLKVGF